MKNKMEQEQSDLNDSYKQSLRNKAERNPTLTKNMPNVKWDQLPPRKGPDSNGIQTSYKQVGANKKVSKKII
jgi:hypothetical protein